MGLRRNIAASACCLLAGAGIAACGEAKVGTSGARATARAGTASDKLVAGSASSAVAGAAGSGRPGAIREVADPQEASSFPAPASVHHAAAATPHKAGEAIVAAGAQSDAEVRAELSQMQAV